MSAVIRIEKFHQSYPGVEDLYHTYCSEHPDWGVCSTKPLAEEEILLHRAEEHNEAEES